MAVPCVENGVQLHYKFSWRCWRPVCYSDLVFSSSRIGIYIDQSNFL